MRIPSLILATAALALSLNFSGTALGQERPARGDRGDRGSFDPEQMRVAMMERYRTSLEVKSDDEWKVIEPRIQKVSDARRANFSGFGGFGGFRGGRGGGPGGPGGPGGRGGFGGETNPDAEALQKAIEAKASNDEIKAKLAKYRESVKAKQAALTAAQEDLKKVLSVRQEATAVTLGLLQ